MSMLENRLESEMTKMGKMIKDTVTGLTDYMNHRLNEVDRKFNNLLADFVPTQMLTLLSLSRPYNLAKTLLHPVNHLYSVTPNHH